MLPLFPIIAASVGFGSLSQFSHLILGAHAVAIFLSVIFNLVYTYASSQKILFKADKLMLRGSQFKVDDFEGLEGQEFYALLKEFLEKQYKVSIRVENTGTTGFTKGEASDLEALREGKKGETSSLPQYEVVGRFWKGSESLRRLCVFLNLPSQIALLAFTIAYNAGLIDKLIAIIGCVIAWVFCSLLTHVTLGVPRSVQNEQNLQRDLLEIEQQEQAKITNRLNKYMGRLNTKRAVEEYHERALKIIRGQGKGTPTTKKFKTN